MITSRVEIIGKKLAEKYLSLNTKNYRSLSVTKARGYAADMAAGKWQLNGEPIVFGEDGILKDGQHRLLAITLADVPVPITVIRGVANDVTVFDVGSNRNIRQMCSARGINVPTTVASAARIFLFGFHSSAVKGVLMDYIIDHADELRAAGTMSTKGRKKAIGEKASVVLFIYICQKLKLFPDELMEDFFWIFNNQTVKSSQLRDPSPALVAARMFVEKYPAGNASVQLKHMNILYLAMTDFKKNKNRTKDYSPDSTDFMPYLNRARAAEGIENVNN